MKLYKPFVIAFIIAVIAMAIFFTAHFQMFFSLMSNMETIDQEAPASVFNIMFSPLWIMSLIFAILSSLAYQVLGIIMIARNPNIESTDRALWIVGFVLAGFITAIVFIALRRSKDLTATEYIAKKYPWESNQNFNL